MTQTAVLQELLRAALTLIAGLLVARVGLSYYFCQKEYETVKQRYLEQSVDLIASEVEAVSWTFSHNWARGLEILRLYRELPGSEFDLQELNTGFLEIRSTNFQRVAHHRLSALIKSDLIWDIYQLALAKHKSLSNKVTIEFVQGVKLHHEGKLRLTHAEFIKESSDLLKPLNDQGGRYAHLVSALQVIAAELEQSKLRFKDLAEFSKRPTVIAALEQLYREFSDDLNDGPESIEDIA